MVGTLTLTSENIYLNLLFQNKEPSFIATILRIVKTNAMLMNHINNNCSVQSYLKTRTTHHFSIFLNSNVKK